MGLAARETALRQSWDAVFEQLDSVAYSRALAG